MSLSTPPNSLVPAQPVVWVVDDSALERETIRRALSNDNRVEVFSNGEELIELLSQRELPDVLVLDWHLPGMSGLEVCRYLRATSATAMLPILLITANARPEDVELGLLAGANDYVFKPFRTGELVARVHALSRSESHRKRAIADERGRRLLAEGTLSEVKAAEEKARQAEAEVRQRADFERQLIGIVSHDLRTPLNAIMLAATALLKSEELVERQRRNAIRVLNSTERATRLIRDLLDFTRARQGGGIPVNRRETNIHELVRTVVEELQATHPERTIQEEHLGDGLGQWDSDRLAQVITNLLGNALQYSPPQTPVQVKIRGEGEAVVLEVHNAGDPIPPEQLPRIFEPMERGLNTQAGQMGRSIGLGLFIVRHIVMAHGGRVSVRSMVEEGTTFTVLLPRRP